jgi:hypothetical protein
MSLRIKTVPATEPVSLTDAKLFLRVDSTADNDLITTLITTARQIAEDYTLRAFITQTWNLWLDRFPWGRKEPWWDGVVEASQRILNGGASEIIIPRPPLISVTHLKTYNDANTATTYSADNYIVDTTSQPGRLFLENGAVWPTDLRAAKAIDVEFVCGYGAAADVPAAIKHAIMMIMTNLYEKRGDGSGGEIFGGGDMMPKMAKNILDRYRVINL